MNLLLEDPKSRTRILAELQQELPPGWVASYTDRPPKSIRELDLRRSEAKWVARSDLLLAGNIFVTIHAFTPKELLERAHTINTVFNG